MHLLMGQACSFLKSIRSLVRDGAWPTQARSVAMRQVRRIITGEDADGKSLIVGEDFVAAVQIAGIALFPLWGVPALPVSLPTTGMGDPGNAKGLGAVRTAIGVLPPNILVRGGDGGHLQFDDEGFHQTESVDVAYVVSGSVRLRVPGAPDTIVNAGDCVVQNGARHAWRNECEQEAVILFVRIDGSRAATPA